MAAKPLVDLYPPVRQLKSLFYGVTDGVLAAPTPCPGWSVGDLLDHLTVLTVMFTQAARKVTDAPGAAAPPPDPSSARLHPQWRGRLPAMLEDLATAWADPLAWTGTAQSGGVPMAADRVGILAVKELTLHGWDLAKATGQDFAADPRTLLVLATFLATAQDGSAAGRSGPAAGQGGPAPSRNRPAATRDGPAGGTAVPFTVDVEDEAALLEQVVGLSGRDPRWRPS
jgi:uncharacterized protein (TIGR03086 family)